VEVSGTVMLFEAMIWSGVFAALTLLVWNVRHRDFD
jgi:hypothetical protein